MPRTKEQFEEMRNATKEKIQLAAMQLFVQKGYGSTNVQDIADLAGISIGLLYRHYKTKEDLFNELMEYAIAGMEKNIAFFESDVPPKQLMDQFVHEIYNDMATGDELANLLILMAQSLRSGRESGSKQNEAAQLSEKMLHAVANLIKKGQEQGEFRSGESYEMAVFFYSAIQGLAEFRVMLKTNFTMPSLSVLTSVLYKEGE